MVTSPQLGWMKNSNSKPDSESIVRALWEIFVCSMAGVAFALMFFYGPYLLR
jgi:hypothetical protein